MVFVCPSYTNALYIPDEIARLWSIAIAAFDFSSLIFKLSFGQFALAISYGS